MKTRILILFLFCQTGFSQNQAPKTIGIVNVSVGNVRSEPAQAAEMSTQILLGTKVKIVEKSKTNNWYLIEMPDKYRGWIEGGAISRLDSMEFEKYKGLGTDLIVTKTQSKVFKFPNDKSEIVSELIWHNRLKGILKKGKFWQIHLADGTKGYVAQKDLQSYQIWLKDHFNVNPQKLIQTAYQLIGIPYLWGGTSIKGLDCSGFTKVIYRDNGLELPRDASQQAREGDLVDSTKNWQNLKTGDLLFFGEKKSNGTYKVVHVGIWEGNQTYLHASERTRRASMNTNSPDFDEYNFKRYLFAKRIQSAANNVQQLADLP
jgi:uncharacterized protein YgiM (DUF1202 family)